MRPGDQSGFSHFEVFAVVALLGILLSVAVPQLTVPETLDSSVNAYQFAVDLRLARQLAIAKRVNYSFELSPSSAPYTSYTIRNESTLVAEPDFPKTIPSGITVTGRRRFTFRPDGCVDDDGVGASCVGSDGEFKVTVGAVVYEVDVTWFTGFVRVKQEGP